VATLRVVTSGDDHLNALSDEFVSCKGDRHDFPKLRVGPLPKGVAATPIRQGQYQLTYTCPDCGTERTKTTLKGGILNSSAVYSYKHPVGYLAPKGAGLVKADYARELGRRVAPHVKAQAHGGEVIEDKPAAAKPRRRGRAG
jgi:hypothetical protein